MKPRPIYSRKDGTLTGYQLRVYAGEREDGSKIIVGRTWRFEPGMAPSKIEKELSRQLTAFEDEVRARVEFEMPSATLQQTQKPLMQLKPEIREPQMTLREFSEFWLASSYNLKQKTLDTHGSKLKRINAVLGDRPLDEVTPVEILTFLNSLREDGANQRTGKALSMKSIREYYVLMKMVFKNAVALKKIDENPMAEIKIPKVKYNRVKALKEEDAATFYNLLLKEAPLKYRAYFLLCLQTGTRRAEAGGLRWRFVDFENNRIQIQITTQYSPSKGIYDETPKAEASYRVLRFTPEAKTALMALKHEFDEARKYIGDEWNTEGYIFTTDKGGPMHPSTPYTWLQRFLVNHGLPRHSVHQLRHTNATLLMANGVDAKSLMVHLGQSDLATTDKYLDFISEKEDLVADTMTNLFEPKL